MGRQPGRRDQGESLNQSGREWLIPVAAAVIAALWAILGSTWIFPELSANSDEGIYLLQADALLAGDLTPTAAEDDAEAFLPWFSVVDGDRYVLKYTPVHAAVLAGGALIGATRLSLGAIAAAQVLAVSLLAGELGLGRRRVDAAAVMMAATPLVLHLSVTYLPYGTSLVLGLLLCTASLRAARLAAPRWAAVAGLLWGIAAFARPYDAVLWAFVVAVALALRFGGRWVHLVPAAIAGSVPPIIALLAFNAVVTGDPFQLPFNLLESDDRLGWGLRRALPGDAPIDFTPARSASSLGRNLLLVVGWTGGGLVGVGLAMRRLVRQQPGWELLVALLVIWPLGYAFFWGSYMTAFVWDGALFLGPYYYLPMVAVLAIAGGAGLVDLSDRSRGLAWVAATGGLILSAIVLVPALLEQRDRSSQRETVAAAIDEAIDGPALIFIPPLYGDYLQNPWSFLRNAAGLDGDRIYVLEGSADRDERIVARHPHRQVLRVTVANGWSDRPGFEPDVEITVEPPEL